MANGDHSSRSGPSNSDQMLSTASTPLGGVAPQHLEGTAAINEGTHKSKARLDWMIYVLERVLLPGFVDRVTAHECSGLTYYAKQQNNLSGLYRPIRSLTVI